MYWCLAAWLYIYIIFGDTWENIQRLSSTVIEKRCV